MTDYSNLSKMFVFGTYNEDESLESWRSYFYNIVSVVSSPDLPMFFSGLSAHVQPSLSFAHCFLAPPEQVESIFNALKKADDDSPHFLIIDVIDPQPSEEEDTT